MPDSGGEARVAIRNQVFALPPVAEAQKVRA